MGIVKMEMFSIKGKGNQSTMILNSPTYEDIIPYKIAVIAIVNTLSGRCIIPTLQSVPNPSALALT